MTSTAEVNNVGKFGVTVNLVLRDQEVRFQLDSGAACNVLRKGDLPSNSRVLPTNTRLKVYNGAVVVPLGIYKGTLTTKKTGMRLEQEFVVESAGISLLRLEACQKLKLMSVNDMNFAALRDKRQEERLTQQF